jgi:hypothetical protein
VRIDRHWSPAELAGLVMAGDRLINPRSVLRLLLAQSQRMIPKETLDVGGFVRRNLIEHHLATLLTAARS